VVRAKFVEQSDKRVDPVKTTCSRSLCCRVSTTGHSLRFLTGATDGASFGYSDAHGSRFARVSQLFALIWQSPARLSPPAIRHQRKTSAARQTGRALRVP
jgi:hypothetical protein